MDVRLSPEQHALRESVARVVDRLGPRTVGELDDAERNAKLDAAVAAAGWRDLRTRSEDGEPWASGVEAALVAEELARALADTAFVGPTLAAELRRLAGVTPSPCAETVALGAGLGSLARCEPGAVVRAAVAIDAAGATAALVREGEGLASVEVSTARRGVDLTRPCVDLDAAAPAPSVGGVIDDDKLARWKALGLALTCADLVGTMRGALQLATQYARARRQYGAPIGSFQAVQHMLADAFVAAEGSSSVTLYASWAVDVLDARHALAAASLAKAYCARAARDVCETAIQVHGGIGNTWDCLAHVFLRRALLSIDILGDAGTSLATVLAHHGLGGSGGLR
jgi:alkylation response protein AidB-like acyl-CoA dehydrogenase